MKTFELKEMISNEVNRLRDDVGEINLLVSGGIDSGVLAALSKPTRLFTVHLPYGPMHDELGDVEKTVKHLGLDDRLTIIELDPGEFDAVMKEAVKAIGRVIPHYNIFPLFCLFRKMHELGITHAVTGDGPDESMAGYTRHLIMNYLYKSLDIPAFLQYQPMIYKILGEPEETYAKLIGKDVDKVRKLMEMRNLIDGMCDVDMELMRPDMDDMGNKLAEHFGIKLHRPYQDNESIDNAMALLPEEEKINPDFPEFGKFLLRQVAEDLIPYDIAWRKQKIGGPLVPVNKIKGWDLPLSDKSMYLQYQEDILNA